MGSGRALMNFSTYELGDPVACNLEQPIGDFPDVPSPSGIHTDNDVHLMNAILADRDRS